VYGSRGRLEAEPFQGYGGNRLYQVGRNGRQEVPYEPVNHFAAEMDDFCACILADQESRTPGEEGLQDMNILTAAYESARTGKAVKIA
jgi:predicted dehydrogenase